MLEICLDYFVDTLVQDTASSILMVIVQGSCLRSQKCTVGRYCVSLALLTNMYLG